MGQQRAGAGRDVLQGRGDRRARPLIDREGRDLDRTADRHPARARIEPEACKRRGIAQPMPARHRHGVDGDAPRNREAAFAHPAYGVGDRPTRALAVGMGRDIEAEEMEIIEPIDGHAGGTVPRREEGGVGQRSRAAAMASTDRGDIDRHIVELDAVQGAKIQPSRRSNATRARIRGMGADGDVAVHGEDASAKAGAEGESRISGGSDTTGARGRAADVSRIGQENDVPRDIDRAGRHRLVDGRDIGPGAGGAAAPIQGARRIAQRAEVESGPFARGAEVPERRGDAIAGAAVAGRRFDRDGALDRDADTTARSAGGHRE